MDQQTQELVNLCPHLSGMTLEEQKLSLTQNRSVLQQHFKAVNLAEKVPLTCPYASILNNGSETWKLEDCRCGICNHYLFKAKRVEPCSHVFCSSCLDRKKVNETKKCTQYETIHLSNALDVEKTF
jgi:late competence protein required for DNA uptake (superfamily II DNA/RNA helicase)